MNANALDAKPLFAEYVALVDDSRKKASGKIDWTMLHKKLVSTAEWTEMGAEHLVDIATKYGSFVLRNALALAVAAGIEDGELGL